MSTLRLLIAAAALAVSAPATAQEQQSYHIVVRAYGETLFDRTLSYRPGVGGDQIGTGFHVPLSPESNGTNQATDYRSLRVELQQANWDGDGTSPVLSVWVQMSPYMMRASGGDARSQGGFVELSESLSLRPGEVSAITPSERVEIRVTRR